MWRKAKAGQSWGPGIAKSISMESRGRFAFLLLGGQGTAVRVLI